MCVCVGVRVWVCVCVCVCKSESVCVRRRIKGVLCVDMCQIRAYLMKDWGGGEEPEPSLLRRGSTVNQYCRLVDIRQDQSAVCTQQSSSLGGARLVGTSCF